jgi:serine/threonine protein kinase
MRLTPAAVGTLAYMAPEQARGDPEKMDERCGVFGLGAIVSGRCRAFRMVEGAALSCAPKADVSVGRAAQGASQPFSSEPRFS